MMNWTAKVWVVMFLVLVAGLWGLWVALDNQSVSSLGEQQSMAATSSPSTEPDASTATATESEPGDRIAAAAGQTEGLSSDLASEVADRPLIPHESMQAPPPELNQSDTPFLEMVTTLSPEIRPLLNNDEQIRKWVLWVHQAANGKKAQQHLPYTLPNRRFLVIEQGDRYFLDPANYQRYNPLVDKVTAIAPNELVSYYRYWLPVLDAAFAEMGESGSLDSRVRLAIEHVLAAKPLTGPIELAPPTTVTYKYLNPDQENASAIHKWLWRTGPENMAKIQQYARRLRAYLDQ
jgi:hypothetical protein